MSKKKMLLYSIYYWPEVSAVAQIYAELCESLASDYDITVVCAVPCYTGVVPDEYKDASMYHEEHNGVRIIRVAVPEYSKQDKLARVRNIAAFYRRARKVTRGLGRYDVVFSYSQPPILGGMLGVAGKRATGGKLVYGIQDFNPEQTLAVGYIGNKLARAAVCRAAMLLDMRSCEQADLVVTVGHDMQKTLERRFEGKGVPNNVVINNWADEERIVPLSKRHPRVVRFREQHGLGDPAEKFVIMYSGNLGLYYDLENLIRVFAQYKNRSDVAFAFVGEGAVKSALESYCHKEGFSNAVFIPYQAKEDLAYSLNAADVHLVTNARGVRGVSVPSKIYGVMASNVPVFGVLEEGSEAWQLVEASGCGVCVHAGDYSEIEEVLSGIISQREAFRAGHATGRAYLEKHLTKAKALEAYRSELEALTERA